MPLRPLPACLIVLALASPTQAVEPPVIYWASDPVRPDETVLLHGSDLSGPGLQVEVARLGDDAAAAAPPPASAWVHVDALQAGSQSLKCVIPAAFKPGIFALRLALTGAAPAIALLNAPDPWWLQADEGEVGTPGGWLRVFGKSLDTGGRSMARLEPAQGPPITLTCTPADGFALRFDLPNDPAVLKPGPYTVRVHNGCGGDAGWRAVGTLRIAPSPAASPTVFSVLETYGPDAVAQMRRTLIKYDQPLDRTEGIHAALKKAEANGGGVVYFPAGRYAIKGALIVPKHTTIRGEGMGLVSLWWGSGHFNLDGGGPQGRALVDEPKPPSPLIYGADFSLEDVSLYLPLEYDQAIVSDERLRMQRVRVRIDHYWLVQGRGNGLVVRLGRNGQVTDCDILAKGEGVKPGLFGVVARNRIMANKCNTPLGGSRSVIVEDNQFVSMDPTAYQNIAGSGRNIYYGHNHHECLYAQQSDFSFTFDASTGAYLGALTAGPGAHVTLAGDPTFPKWAAETSELWRRSAICILAGRGAGQWRDVVANHAREWDIDRPFATPPDASSIATIVPFNGRTLIIGNHFEDANWVNAGYVTSIDVVCAQNQLLRCADMMNYGVRSDGWFEPSWQVQYFDNSITQGQTKVGSNGDDGHRSPLFAGPLTCWAVHRRQSIAADNSGSIVIGGNIVDAVVEGCVLRHALSAISIDGLAEGVLCRANAFAGTPSPHYVGDGAARAVVDKHVDKPAGKP